MNENRRVSPVGTAERIFASHGFRKTKDSTCDKYIYRKGFVTVVIEPMTTTFHYGHDITVIDNYIIRGAAQQIMEIFRKDGAE